MLVTAQFPGTYWTLAIEHAVWLYNALFHSIAKAVPFVTWWTNFDLKPDFTMLKPFGSIVYILVPKQNRAMGKDHARRLIFVGLDNVNRRSMKCMDANTNAITKESLLYKSVVRLDEFGNLAGTGFEETREKISRFFETPARHVSTIEEDDKGTPTFNLGDLKFIEVAVKWERGDREECDVLIVKASHPRKPTAWYYLDYILTKELPGKRHLLKKNYNLIIKLLEKTELKSDSVVGRRATFKHSNSRWHGLVVREDLSGTQRLNLTVVDDSVYNSTDVDDVETQKTSLTALCCATLLL